jgi:hypothetical protein
MFLLYCNKNTLYMQLKNPTISFLSREGIGVVKTYGLHQISDLMNCGMAKKAALVFVVYLDHHCQSARNR